MLDSALGMTKDQQGQTNINQLQQPQQQQQQQELCVVIVKTLPHATRSSNNANNNDDIIAAACGVCTFTLNTCLIYMFLMYMLNMHT